MGLCYKILIGFSILLATEEVLADDDFCYTAGFSEKVISSDDLAIVNFTLVPGPDGDDTKAGLTGSLELLKDLPPDAKLELEINKKTENGEEPAMAVVSQICQSLKDEKAPWYNMTSSMGMTECPVVADLYLLPSFYLDISFAQPCLTHEYVGLYTAKMNIVDDKKNLLTSISFELSISEEECSEDKK